MSIGELYINMYDEVGKQLPIEKWTVSRESVGLDDSFYLSSHSQKIMSRKYKALEDEVKKLKESRDYALNTIKDYCLGKLVMAPKALSEEIIKSINFASSPHAGILRISATLLRKTVEKHFTKEG